MKYTLPLFSTVILFMMLIASGCRGDQSNQEFPETPPPNSHQEDLRPEPGNGSDVNAIGEDYVNTNRVIWQKPNMVIDLLGDLEDKTVADIGAGTGFFSLRLVPRAKKVIAIDIEKRFIDYLDSVKVLELPETLQPRLDTRLVPANDPQLAPGEADVVLIVNTYMYLRNRVAYMKILQRGVSEGGKVIIVDFKKKRTAIGPPPSHERIPVFQVEEELYEAGFTDVIVNDTSLDYQYIVIATKRTG